VSQLRLLIDEDAQHRGLAPALRARGVDVTTVREVGMLGADDDVILSHAAAESRAIYTLNASDFYRLHTQWLQQGREHAGIIIVPRQRYSIGEQIRRLFALINSRSAENMRNQVTFL
jgi:predicted nuclease of predicted toxin-antitoxin system